MNFNSFIFLSLFLPVFIIIYLVSAPKYRNLVALIASLLFFSLGQAFYLPLMVLIIVINYYLGRWIEKLRNQPAKGRIFLILGCGLNLIPLVFFKVIVSYGVRWLPYWVPGEFIKYLQLYLAPLGLSYIVFQLISYLIDIGNELCDSEKSFTNFTLYVILFPKILVGPIVRYRDISSQLLQREVNSRDVANGARRFIQGLAKKILIADTIAMTINPVFALKTPNFSIGIAWFALIGYALQLYFDFSGFTDMAIGLGQIMGFRFMENFNYPYISRSISEFWRRWHISLSTWFREYVFYPLEFTRRKSKFMIQPLNIVFIFMLTGLWHGLTLNFLLWGAIHGMAVALEVVFLGKWLKKAWTPIQNIYALVIVLISWVFFRSNTLGYAIGFFARLAGSSKGISILPFSDTSPLPIIDPSVWLVFVGGIILSFPIIPAFQRFWQRVMEKHILVQAIGVVGTDLLLFMLLVFSVAALISRTNTPANIYANF
jgi:alginate O-acetyltransferase complex protein AlgI